MCCTTVVGIRTVFKTTRIDQWSSGSIPHFRYHMVKVAHKRAFIGEDRESLLKDGLKRAASGTCLLLSHFLEQLWCYAFR